MPSDPHVSLDGRGVELGAALGRCLGRPVDLVVLNRAPVDLIHRVLRDGILLYERDPAARIRFEVKARNEYFDRLPWVMRDIVEHRLDDLLAFTTAITSRLAA